MSDIKLITINSRKRIPYLNMLGPIVRPISVSVKVFEKLKALGYPVMEHVHKTDAVDETPSKRIEQNTRAHTSTETSSAMSPNMLEVPKPLVSDDILHVEETPVEEVPETEEALEETEVEETEDDVEETPVEGVPETENSVEETEDDVEETEDDVEETEDDVEEDSDFVDDEGNVLVHTITEYKSWRKDKVLRYLNVASEYLTPEEFDSLADLTKSKLLDLIETNIIEDDE